MKRHLLLLTLVAALGPPVAAQNTHYVSPDVPTDDPGGSGTIFLPWDVIEYKGGVYKLPPAVTFPPNTAIDAVHKMDKPGHWLFSVESPAELPPLGSVFFGPEDVGVFDGLSYGMVFDGSANGVPAGANVDAVFLLGDDSGDLILSFDAPTTIGATTYQPSDLVRYSGGGFSLYLGPSGIPPSIALSDNVTGADESAGYRVLSMDIPSDLAPSTGPTTYLPGQLADWDGVNFNLYDALAGWPLSSEVDAFSCQANPGRVYDRLVYPFPITMDKSTLVPGNVVIGWTQSCSSGAEDYGIYEGALGTWYSHKRIICSDLTGGPYDEDFTPMAGDSYYLVVPHNGADEGAYGLDYDPTRVPPRIERPQPGLVADRCVPSRVLTPCP